MESRHLSQEKVLKTLRDLGLTRLDSKIYIYLAKKGSKKGIEISKALKVQKQQIYSSLKNLQKKAIVGATLEHPARFSAVPFEKVLDLFIRAKLEEAQNIQTEKKKLLSSWQTIQSGETPDVTARFMVIEGRSIIYSRIKQMINEAKSQLSLISAVTGLARADRFGLLDYDFKRPRLTNVQFRLLTHITEENANLMQALLNETPKTEMRFEIRNPNLGLGLFPQMVIRDEEEVMFFINPKVDDAPLEQDKLCLWTNCKSLIHSFLALFEELWRNSTDIEKKITELKTGKATPKTYVISDPKIIKEKYDEMKQSSRNEILILTSSRGLIEQSKEVSQLRKLTRNGVIVKIMAPIVKENWEAMKQLSKVCNVRHVPLQYWRTTIIDGKYLLQSKTRSSSRGKLGLTDFDNAFYSDDPEWAKTMRTALLDIWKSSQPPSTETLASIIGPYGSPLFPMPNDDLRSKFIYKVIDFKPPGTITQEDVLNKIMRGKRFIVKDPSKDIQRSYGSYAFALIHPPDQINLPDMLIQVQKHHKKSSYGEGDDLTVYLWLDTPTGHAYVPVAVINDNPNVPSPTGMDSSDTLIANNYHLVKKEELQVLVHGNTIFAGWTVPIQLYPPNFVLPPACLLIEGYGDLRTSKFTMASPSGFRTTFEDNTFNAFVTFIHQESKYSGPGTDGVFIRDSISTTIPP